VTDDTFPPEDRVDLTPLRDDTAMRASRVAAGLAPRVAAARQTALRRRAVWDAMRRRLGRLAIPAVLAAAAALAGVILTTRTPPPPSALPPARPDPFAGIILGSGPAARWIALDRRPDVAELVTIVGGAR
jgi:hypothetical protein